MDKLDFKQIIEAVEENNHMNDACWADWQSVSDIFDVYDIELDEDEDEYWIYDALERAIESNGKSLLKDFEEWEFKKWGVNFVGFSSMNYYLQETYKK